MAATIEGAFVLIDRASGTMKNMEQQAKKTMAAIRGVGVAQDLQSRRARTASTAMSGGTAEMRKHEQEAQRTRKAVEGLGVEHQKSSSKLKVLENAFKSLRSEMNRLRGSSGAVGGMTGIQALQKDLKTARGAISDFLGAFKSLGSALMAFKIPAMGAGIALAGQSFVSLGGAAAAALPLLQAAGAAMMTYPSAAAAAAQGLFSVKAAFAGVMQAVNAGMQAQNQWALNQRDFQQQVTSALDAVISAHQGLTNAIYDQQQAQISLTVARRDAVRQLQDMEFAAQTSVLKEARAGLDIQQAKMELQQAMMSPGTTQLQLQSLRLGVMEAQSSAQQTHVEARRSRQDANRARRGDPTSAPTMAVNQAQHALSQSTIGISNAQRSLVRSQQALNIMMANGNAGVAAYTRALMGLAPIQQKFVKFLVGGMGPGNKNSLVGQFQALQEAAGEGLFPGLIRGVHTLMGGMGMLRTNVKATGTVMGNFGASLVNVFFGRRGMAQTNSIMHANVTILSHLTGAGTAVAEMLRKLMVAADPTVIWASKAIEQWAQMHDRMMSTAAGQQKLADRFAKLRTITKELFEIFHQLFRIFDGVANAAWGLNQVMMKGSETGLKKWADWANSTTGQDKMKKWFMGLLPILRALKGLVEDVAKALVGMVSPQNAGGAAKLINGLRPLVPLLQQTVLNLEKAFGPGVVTALLDIGKLVRDFSGNGSVFAIWLSLLDKVVKAFQWLLKLPGVGTGLAVFFTSLFAVNTIAKFVMGMTGAIAKVALLRKAWAGVGAEQKRALNSPVTSGGKGGFWSRLTGGGGGGSVIPEWGVKSGSGPGSLENPLMVRVEGGMGGPGNALPGGSAASDTKAAGKLLGAGQDVSRLGKIGFAMADMPVLSKALPFLSKIPGLGGLTGGIGAATKLTMEGGKLVPAAAEAGGVLSKLGVVGGALGKLAGPLGLGLMALPGVLSFFGTKGSFGTKAQAAGNATVSGLTFGLAPHVFGVSDAYQKAQGTRRGLTTWNQIVRGSGPYAAGGGYDKSTGMLTSAQTAEYNRRLQTLTSQAATAGSRSRTGQWMPDMAVVKDRLAQFQRLQAQMADYQTRIGAQQAQNWQTAFGSAMQHGTKPQAAMKQMVAGMSTSLVRMGPMGKRTMLMNMEQWAQQMAVSGQLPKAQVDQLNRYIVAQFQAMGQNVQIVNGQILTGSTQEWGQISNALTNPMLVAQEKLAGSFGKIQQMAIGSLQAMGLTPSNAKTLVQGLTSGTVTAADARSVTTVNPATGLSASVNAQNQRVGRAVGGRIGGSDPRDVYQLGGNMVGGGELVMNKWHEADANARLMRHGEPTVGAIVASRNTPHWAFAGGGRALGDQSFPFPKGTPFSWQRIDQGQDMEESPGAPVLAIGPGIVSQASDKFSGFGPFYATEQLTGGPLAGRGVYYGHTKIAKTGRVNAGDIIAYTQSRANTWTAAPAGWLELGFLPYGSMSAGAAIAPYLHQLASGSMMAGTKVGGGVSATAAQQMKALKAPRIQGLGGVPDALAQRASDSYAVGLTQQINSKLGAMGGTGTGGGNVSGAGIPPGSWKSVASMLAKRHGWNAQQLADWWWVEQHEDGGLSLTASNSSGAYGLAQFINGPSEYAQYGGNSNTIVGQLTAMANYIAGRYGSPTGARTGYFNRYGPGNSGYASGGRISDAGWFAKGGTFTTNGPTIFGAGEGGRKETVTVTPAGTGTRPIEIRIEKIEVHRKGDIKKIVDEELQLLADSLTKGNH